MHITIASIDQKDKLSFVTTTDGQKLRCWNDRAARFGLEPNAGFEIETESTQYGTHIKTAKRVAAVRQVTTSAPPREPFVSGAYRTQEAVSAPPAFASKEEELFTLALLKSLIEAGEVTLDRTQILNVIRMLRSIRRETFGREAIQHQMQAAE